MNFDNLFTIHTAVGTVLQTSCKLCPVAAMTSSVAEANASVRPLRVV